MKALMIKKYICSAAILFAAVSATFPFGVDFGVVSGTTFSAEGDSIEGSGKANLNTKLREDLTGWMKMALTRDEKLTFSSQATVSWENAKKYEKDRETKVGADLDLFKLTYLEKTSDNSSCSVSFGRFSYSHSSGIVFVQKNDGVLLKYSAPRVKLGLYGGYTGLLNQQTVKILNEEGKNYRKTDEKKWYKRMYEWADPYVTTSLAMSFPYLFLNQTLSFEVSSFIGARGPAYKNRGLNYNRYYATLGFSGPIAPKVTYAVATTMSTERFNQLGNLSQLSFTYHTGFKSLLLSLNGIYASGNENGPFDRFIAFTSSSATYALDAPEYSGLFKIGPSLSIKPLKCLYIGAGADVVFLRPNKTITHDGWQWYFTSTLQCSNDCSVSLTEFRYYCTDHSKDGNRSNGGMTLKLSLAF